MNAAPELQFPLDVSLTTEQTVLTYTSPWVLYRSVPTQDQILVPETLLKKRKSQEKEREARLAEVGKKKKVRDSHEERLRVGHDDENHQSQRLDFLFNCRCCRFC